METINTWLEQWEPIWLFLILFVETLAGFGSLYILIKEYRYDERKDIEKKQRRTKTTKRTTRNPGGSETIEESSETVEDDNVSVSDRK